MIARKNDRTRAKSAARSVRDGNEADEQASKGATTHGKYTTTANSKEGTRASSQADSQDEQVRHKDRREHWRCAHGRVEQQFLRRLRTQRNKRGSRRSQSWPSGGSHAANVTTL
jgi:hypothetical protein